MNHLKNEFERYLIKNIIVNVKNNVFNIKHNDKCIFQVSKKENPIDVFKRLYPDVYKKEYDTFFDIIHPY